MMMKIKNMLLLVAATMAGTISYAQRASSQMWIEQESSTQKDIQTVLQEASGDSDNHWVEIKTWEDYLQTEHIRFQQHHLSIPIEGAVSIAHGSHGSFHSYNGLLVHGDFPSSEPTLSSSQALFRAHEVFSDKMFYHEDKDMESWIKEFKSDVNATFSPEPELVFVDPKFSNQASNYRLAYKMDLWMFDEVDHVQLFVDAHSGQEVWRHNLTTTGCFKHNHGAQKASCSAHSTQPTASLVPREGSGLTYYNGIQEFVADSVRDSTYILWDRTRGGGIRTLNAQRDTTTRSAINFEDDDNFWDLRNSLKDEAALDAHWGAAETYDFWLDQYNWNSYDGNGSGMTSYVHWRINWFNASWNGLFARFGDGRGDPLTYIDITAHEFTHGLTGTTSGLIYQDESGALNESFSDIFGTAVEFAAVGDSAPYVLGIPFSPFRDMSNPSRFDHPDTYLGANWTTGSGDNGGVHTNSGVQNFWWYLLANGGSGINDNGLDYEVNAIGMEKATAIAFRNLVTYLTPSSSYVEARYGSLLAARDLYGACSPEVEAVSQAWFAVGIGSPEVTTDLELVSSDVPGGSCREDFGDFSVEYRLNPTGCDIQLDSGSTVQIGIQLNDDTPIIEEYVLKEDLVEGGVLSYSFNQKPEVNGTGLFLAKVWIQSSEDAFGLNDTIKDLEIRNPVTHVESPARVQFKNFGRSVDSFYTVVGANAVAEISISAGNRARAGRLGFAMTGQNASPGNIDFPRNEEENFTKNPGFGAKICFCVDATDWRQVKVAFDRKQSFSAIYRQQLGVDIPQFVSSLRMLLNGEQVGPQFHPTTYIQDPWVTDTFHLEGAEGQSFEFCFEGKHFVDRRTDADLNTMTRGDNTYLDEVIFFDPFTVSNQKVITQDLKIQPNPGEGEFVIHLPDAIHDRYNLLEVRDQQGRLVYRQTDELDGTRLSIRSGDWPSGVYQVMLYGENKLSLGQWVKM